MNGKKNTHKHAPTKGEEGGEERKKKRIKKLKILKMSLRYYYCIREFIKQARQSNWISHLTVTIHAFNLIIENPMSTCFTNFSIKGDSIGENDDW